MKKKKSLVLGVALVWLVALLILQFSFNTVKAENPIVHKIDFSDAEISARVSADCIKGNVVTCTGHQCVSRDPWVDQRGHVHDGWCTCDSQEITYCPNPTKA